MAEKKGKFKFDDDLKEWASKVGAELKKTGSEMKKDLGELGSKVKGKLKK